MTSMIGRNVPLTTLFRNDFAGDIASISERLASDDVSCVLDQSLIPFLYLARYVAHIGLCDWSTHHAVISCSFPVTYGLL